MTDQQKAIAALITAIESGEFDALPGSARSPYFNRFMDIAEYALPQNVTGCNALAWRAYHQHSLDAARSLHDALLPGWDVACLDQASNLAGSPWGCEVASFNGTNPDKNRKAYSGHNFDQNPARAWLLAILRALKSQVNHD